jgi:flagellar biosynthesis/type III secretory pathway M-ring protein FliF/YscJ
LITIGAGVIVAGFNKFFTTISRKRSFVIVLLVSLVVLSAVVFVSWDRSPRPRLIVEGTVVDDASSNGIGQAVVTSDSGRSCTSVDNGNFVMDLTGDVKESQRVRIRVTKNGYKPYDGSVAVPAHEVMVPLHHL